MARWNVAASVSEDTWNAREDRIEELEGELRKWLEIYARSESGATIAVPVYQIERLLKST